MSAEHTLDLAGLSARLLHAAAVAGANDADVIVVSGTSITADVRGGALEQAERAEGTEIGLRVLIGKKQAIVSSSDTRDSTFAAMAERAVAMAKAAPDDPHIGLASPDQLATNIDVRVLDMADPTAEPQPAELEGLARRAEAAALAHGGISQVQSAGAAYGRRQVHLASTNGFSAGYTRTDHALSCVAISGTDSDMERDWDHDSRAHAADMRSPEDIGILAATRAAQRLGARRPKTGPVSVLFDERVSGTLIGHLLQAINGTMIARGSSWLRDALGTQILPANMTLREDPHRPRCAASRLFDAEGLATKPRNIVENGVLTGWTLDLATARKLGLQSTGNASRGPGSPPSPGAGNVMLSQGSKSPAELMADMGTGLLVTSLIGSTVNPNTGDYSRGASGFWIENGALAYPVTECTIAGNLPQMLRALIASNDARPHLSRVVPSLLVEDMALAGA